jgi:hypothetical protein
MYFYNKLILFNRFLNLFIFLIIVVYELFEFEFFKNKIKYEVKTYNATMDCLFLLYNFKKLS